MANTTWVKFKLSGVPYGYAYSSGSVVELPTAKAKSLYSNSVAVPADAEEIETAKAVIAADAEKAVQEATLEAENVQLQADKTALLAEIAQLKSQLQSKK